ncbi:MAG: DALR anticodon-binding domain-containing protein [Oscillospiraceae bacterium]|nr:DALR anticodon-binding domain-containing protein [Oscillospiraceae bacterium]
MFDWDNILNFQGETGPYIQYIYVRTKSVLEKAGYIPNIEDVKSELLTEKEAVSVLKELYKFDKVLEQAAEKNEPSILARYLIDLAQAYSSFYNEHKILVDDKETQNARLFLNYSCGIVLKTGAELLGLEMPNKM